MNDQSHDELLAKVLDIAVQNNQRARAGTPLADLKAAIEAALSSLPPLEFAEFDDAVGDAGAAGRLIQRAPELIGWNADQIVAWMEELAGKINLQLAAEGSPADAT
jgi:hypothetical protein